MGMKSTIATFLLFFFTSLPFLLPAQTTFAKEIFAAGAGGTYGKDFLLAPGGGYYLLTQAHPLIANNWGPVLVRLDALGNEIWQRKYVVQSNQYESIDEMRFAPDGNIILSGTFNRILKVDLLGNQLWSVQVPGVGLSAPRVESMALDSKGNIALGLHYFNSTPRIMLADSLGGPVWIRGYQLPSSGGYFEDLDHLAGGGYLLTLERGFLATVDSAGNGEWLVEYSTENALQLQSSVEEANGSFTTIGASQGPTGQQHIYLLRTLPDGSFGWARRYETNEEMIGEDIAATPDGGYLLAGTYLDNKTFVLKVDSTGAPLWNAFTDQILANSYKRIRYTPDGGSAIIGMNLASGENAYFLKMDSLGRNGCLSSSLNVNYIDTPVINHDSSFFPTDSNLVLNLSSVNFTEPNLTVSLDSLCPIVALDPGQETSGLLVGPNPSNGNFLVRWEHAPLDPVKLQLFDMQGKLVWKEMVSGKEVRLELEVNPGLYLLRLDAKDKPLAKKIIVE